MTNPKRETRHGCNRPVKLTKDPIRLGRYHCTYEKAHGNLSLDTEGVFFELHLTAKEKWRLKYTELKSVQKVNPHDSSIHGW